MVIAETLSMARSRGVEDDDKPAQGMSYQLPKHGSAAILR